jgi:hypothetical protein
MIEGIQVRSNFGGLGNAVERQFSYPLILRWYGNYRRASDELMILLALNEAGPVTRALCVRRLHQDERQDPRKLTIAVRGINHHAEVIGHASSPFRDYSESNT